MIFETGKIAKLADGAVTVQMGETVVLVTAVSQTKIKEGKTSSPLRGIQGKGGCSRTFPRWLFRNVKAAPLKRKS